MWAAQLLSLLWLRADDARGGQKMVAVPWQGSWDAQGHPTVRSPSAEAAALVCL